MEKEIPLTEAVYYILLAVRKPNHGYGIIQEVEQLTSGRVRRHPDSSEKGLDSDLQCGNRIKKKERIPHYGFRKRGILRRDPSPQGTIKKCRIDGGIKHVQIPTLF